MRVGHAQVGHAHGLVAQPAGATESVVTVTQAVPAIKIEDGVVAAAEKLVGSPSARASATGASWNPINWFSGSKAAAGGADGRA